MSLSDLFYTTDEELEELNRVLEDFKKDMGIVETKPHVDSIKECADSTTQRGSKLYKKACLYTGSK